MKTAQIQQILDQRTFPDSCDHPHLVETHISWVILSTKQVYKIKKPLKYSFLNFSTLKKRKHFCEQELILNNRLTSGIYLKVLPVHQQKDQIRIGGSKGKVIDYALVMKRLQRSKEMDKMLVKNSVTRQHVRAIADELVPFHRAAKVIKTGCNIQEFKGNFNDLLSVKDYVKIHIDKKAGKLLDKVVRLSNSFLTKHETLLSNRYQEGFVRDCHGDLHSGNIFLYKKPIIFDCIEFNDAFRQIDVLNEIAFFCMDLEDYGKDNLSQAFLQHYLKQFPCIRDKKEEQLFLYFKLYRANVKAKVSALKAMQTKDEKEKAKRLMAAKNYLSLLERYGQSL